MIEDLTEAEDFEFEIKRLGGDKATNLLKCSAVSSAAVLKGIDYLISANLREIVIDASLDFSSTKTLKSINFD